MKILIAVDMEGITGVIDWKQVESNQPEYKRFRKIMTDEVNAAINGSFLSGADEVVVTDGHDKGLNILIEELDPRARLNSGLLSPLGMVEGVQSGVDAVLFVGYHARAGASNATLCHTFTGQITNIWLNGRAIGEVGLNSALAGYYGVPTLMVTGDAAVCAEACDWVPEIEKVCVKQSAGRYSAKCLPPEVTYHLVEKAAERAVQRIVAGQRPKALQLEKPVIVRMEFTTPNYAESALTVSGTKRIDGRTVEMTQPDMYLAYQAIRTAAFLGQ